MREIWIKANIEKYDFILNDVKTTYRRWNFDFYRFRCGCSHFDSLLLYTLGHCWRWSVWKKVRDACDLLCVRSAVVMSFLFRRSSRESESLLCSFCGVQATEKVNEITSKENNVRSFKFETFMFYVIISQTREFDRSYMKVRKRQHLL